MAKEIKGAAVADEVIVSDHVVIEGRTKVGAGSRISPFAIVGGAWGMAKMKRAKKEKAIKTALTGCLEERGYAVNNWERVRKTRTSSGSVATAAAAR